MHVATDNPVVTDNKQRVADSVKTRRITWSFSELGEKDEILEIQRHAAAAQRQVFKKKA